MRTEVTDVSGRVFGGLKVLGRAGWYQSGRWREATWLCACACGTVVVKRGGPLRNGQATHCGCQRAIRCRLGATRHGLRHLPEYVVWKSMRQRCSDPRGKSYPRYGGRGITICSRWDLFEAFALDMGPRPSPKHSVDRINNDGNYEPGNCRWATAKEQAANRRPSLPRTQK